MTDVEIKGYKTAKGGRNEIQETKSLLPPPPKKKTLKIFLNRRANRKKGGQNEQNRHPK